MKSIFIIIFLAFSFTKASFAQSTSIFSYSVNEIGTSNSIPLSNYSGKKMLIVNIATQSKAVDQIGRLQELYSKFKDSGLVIIAIPSNSFGNEPGSDEEIMQYLQNRFQPAFIIGKKDLVTGDNLTNVFAWLTDIQKNGLLNRKIKEDFAKYLISKDGKIIGIFSQVIDPLDPVVLESIRKN